MWSKKEERIIYTEKGWKVNTRASGSEKREKRDRETDREKDIKGERKI